MQFEREALQEEPENHDAINIKYVPILADESKLESRPNRSSIKKSEVTEASKSNIDYQSEEEVIHKIDEFNALSTQSESDWEDLKILLEKHILPNIHPKACSEAGKKLLTNGKFVIAFIKVMTRNSKTDFLKKYLVNHFQEEIEIENEKEVFKTFCQETENKPNKSNYKTVNRDKKHLGSSPASSKNDVNWSSVAEHDDNSSRKSFITSPLKDGEKLKRSRIKEEPRLEESNHSKRKASKNIKKGQNSGKAHSKSKSTKKTKIEIENKETLKNMKNSAKKTVPKSSMLLKTKSIEDVIQSNLSNENDNEETLLGSYYHYEIGINKKSEKQLMQVRTSARFNKKIENNSTESRRASSRIQNSVSKSKSKKEGSSVPKSSKQKSKKVEVESSEDKESESVSEFKEDNETNSESEDLVEVDWVKSHLKELKISNVQLYSDYKALTQNDNQITQFLLQMENSQEAENLENTSRGIKSQTEIIGHPKKEAKSNLDVNQDGSEHEGIVEANNEEDSYFLALEKNSDEKPRQFEEIKNEFSIGELPLTIDYIVDPDLCNHGVYALLRLGRVTELEMGTPFAVSPLSYSMKISRKNIKESLEKAKELAGEFAENIGYVPTNGLILDMIGEKKKEINYDG